MNVSPKRLLLVVPGNQHPEHLQDLLEAEDWQVDQRSVMEAFPVSQCDQYQVIVIEPSIDGEAEVMRLLEHCPEYSSAVILPILRDPSPQGVVNLIRSGVVDVLLPPFTDHEFIETVNRVAGHKNLYLENLSYSDELEKTNRELRESLNILRMDQLAGRQVQKSLLPRSPLNYGEYEIAYRIIPSLYLSGDFVGFNVVLDRFVLFYLADVSGHGASSAFVTILLRFMLRRILNRHTNQNDIKALSRAPEGFMEYVNRQLIATGLEKHLTMFAGAIDLETSLLRYTVAAQMPMPIFVAGGDARFLPGKGKPIGFFEDTTWEVQEIALPKTFSLHVVSDGLLEALPGDTLKAKEAHLLDLVARKGESHDPLCEALGLNDIGEAADDISILSVFRRSSS